MSRRRPKGRRRIQRLPGLVKPAPWAVNRAQVAPEWQWFWDATRGGFAYPCNEKSGTILRDVVGNNNIVFATGGAGSPVWITGTSGPLVECDGGTDYLVQEKLIGTLNDFSIIIVFRTTTTATNYLLRVVNNGSNEIIGLQFNTDSAGSSDPDSLWLQVRTPGDTIRNASFNDPTWRSGKDQFLAMIREGDTTRMSLNGVEKTLTVGADTLNTSALVLDEYLLTIAAANDRGVVSGYSEVDLSLIALCPVALTESQVRQWSRDLFGPFRFARSVPMPLQYLQTVRR